MVTQRLTSKWLSLAFFSLLLVGCSKDAPNPVSTPGPQEIDASCGLVKVYRDNQNVNQITTLYISDGYGSDTVKYYNSKDSTLINYTTFAYNAAGKVLVRKIFDPTHKLTLQVNMEYWSNGLPKLEKWEKINPESLYDQTNTFQETRYDEQGNIIEYKNLSTERHLMNHLLYTNSYSNGHLEKSIRDDQVYNFDATTEYFYNSKGLNTSSVTKDPSGKTTYKLEKAYDEQDYLIELKSYNATALIRTETLTLNKKGIKLQSTVKAEDGSTQVVHDYQYQCPK
jgi:hypothetical protein